MILFLTVSVAFYVKSEVDTSVANDIICGSHPYFRFQLCLQNQNSTVSRPCQILFLLLATQKHQLGITRALDVFGNHSTLFHMWKDHGGTVTLRGWLFSLLINLKLTIEYLVELIPRYSLDFATIISTWMKPSYVS